MRAALAFVIAAAAPAAAQFTLNLLDSTKHPLAQCLDGSQGGYYISPGDPNTVIIHTQGGGWCIDEQDCVGRSKTPLGSNAEWTRGYVDCEAGGDAAKNAPVCYADGGANGMLSNSTAVNPLLANATKIFINYCDGASYAGTVDTPVHTNGTVLSFMGHYILEGIYDELLAPGGVLTTAGVKVIIKGCSAGGLAVYLHADRLSQRINAINPSARVVASPGAGFFLDALSYSGVKAYTPHYQYVARMQNVLVPGSVNDACLAAKNATTQWQCFMAPYTLPFVKTPLFIMNSLADSWQGGNIMDLPCVPSQPNSCSPAEIAYVNAYRQQMLAQLAPLLSNPANGAFLQTCWVHVVEDSTHNYASVHVAGQTEQSTFAAWFTGDASQKWQIVDGVWGSNPTC